MHATRERFSWCMTTVPAGGIEPENGKYGAQIMSGIKSPSRPKVRILFRPGARLMAGPIALC